VSMKSCHILPRDISLIRGEILDSTLLHGVGGFSGVGRVSRTSQNSGFAINEAVFTNADGCWAEEVLLPEESVAKFGNLSVDEATALPSYLSAWAILASFQVAQEGSTILQLDGDSSIGTALSELGKAQKLNIISPTPEEVEDVTFLQKWKGKIAFAVAGSPTFVRTLSKTLCPGAKAIFYNAKYTPTSACRSVDFPISSAIFQRVTVSGFDYVSWVRSSPTSYQQALQEVSTLILEKKVPGIKVTKFALADYQKAISHAAKTSSGTVLEL